MISQTTIKKVPRDVTFLICTFFKMKRTKYNLVDLLMNVTDHMLGLYILLYNTFNYLWFNIEKGLLKQFYG